MIEQRLRLGLVGAGRRGKEQAATIAGLTDLYDLVAVCDSYEPNAQRLAKSAGAKPYSDVLECFATEHLDAVVITTPPEAHHLIAKAAADRRIHMLVETPLAPTRAMMDFIGEIAAKAGVQVAVGENYGRRPGERLTRAAVEAGLIGELTHLSAFNAPANHESCYHVMSLFLSYAASDVEEVHALANTSQIHSGEGAGAVSPTETWVDAALAFKGGVTASFSYVTSWTTPPRWGRPRIASVEGTDGYIVKVDGSPDRLHRVEDGTGRDYVMRVETGVSGDAQIPTRYYFDTAPSVVGVANPFSTRRLADADPSGVADGLARAAELLSLHRAVLGEAAPEYGVERARRSQELGLAVIESARTEQPVRGRLDGETSWERAYHQELAMRWGADPLLEVDVILKGAAR